MENNFLKKLISWRLNQIIYPVIITIYVVLMIALFALTTKFLSSNLNKIFSLDTKTIQANLITLNLEKFYPIAKKLGIQIIIPVENAEPTEAPTAPETTEPPVTTIPEQNNGMPTTETTVQPLDKSSLTITVLNGTKKSGLAAELKTTLENDGFKVGKTGNNPTAQNGTIIKLKESKKDFFVLIKDAVAGKYELNNYQTLEEENTVDAIIVIGN